MLADGAFSRIATSGSDPEKQRLAEALGSHSFPADKLDAISATGKLMKEHKPALLSAVSEQQLADGRSTPGCLQRLHAGSVIVAPMAARGHLLGLVTLIRTRGNRQFCQADVQSVESYARRAALAIDNARLLSAEQQARREAEVANTAKDQFIALISHELRNPLNAIKAAVHLLRGTCQGNQAARMLNIVERNTDVQARLVNDLLEISRLQRGKLDMLHVPVRIHQTLLLSALTV